MKYFVVDPGDLQFTRVTSLRRWLKEHPEPVTIHRYWWYRDDLVECVEVTREEITGQTVRDLTAGATAQWAVRHRR